MGYYTRVLTKHAECVPCGDLSAALRAKHPKAVLAAEGEDPALWENLILPHSDGRAIASIERNPVLPGALGADEIAEFIEKIAGCKPASAVPWLTSFLRSVKTIYAFQHLSGTEVGKGAEALRAGARTVAGLSGLADRSPVPDPRREQLRTLPLVAAIQDGHVRAIGAPVDADRPRIHCRAPVRTSTGSSGRRLSY